MDIFNRARQKEILYHETLYEETVLFQPGSWLAKPVQTVLDHLELLSFHETRVLDLACGVGRNSIPVAQRILAANGQVVCVDLLPSAVEKLRQYAVLHGVSSNLEAIVADVEHYDIAVDTYHYVIACSCLEHMSSEDAFVSKIEQMKAGTVHQGIHCIMMSTEVKEIDQETGLEEEGLIELNLSADRAFSMLDDLYSEWEILTRRQVQQDIQEVKDGRDILFRSQWITFTARKGVC
ncbi:class I SAM-dependent methyltransferase [Paenibacillus sp. FSL W7-1332]|uniref:class I SAM-dependent methyltransferase n=1 Tax=Paenibacillus sp. FSL W7-1332 TaxID=2921702 RepID=UPI0030CC5705